MSRLGLIILVAVAVLVLGQACRIKTIGRPVGGSARIGDVIVTVMERLEPYVPSLNRNHGDDRYTVGLLVHSARDSAARRFVPTAKGQTPSSLHLMRIMAVDGDLVWFVAPERGAYNVKTGRLVAADQLPTPPRETRETLYQFASDDRTALRMLIAGGYPEATRWFGVLNDTEAGGGFQPGSSLSDADPFERSKEPRKLFTTAIERVEGTPRIKGLKPLGGEGMFNAGFVREGRERGILRLTGDGYLLVYETTLFRPGLPPPRVVAARMDFAGKTVWTVDTGIGDLRQILPDPAFPVFIGERPQVPDHVPEPILVVLDAATGQLTTHSLWLR